MTKTAWDRQCKAIADAAWATAHAAPRRRLNGKMVSVTEAARVASVQAAQAARAVKDSADSLVLARFMERASMEKRARSEALVSHSVKGLADSTAMLDSIVEARMAVTARWNALEGRARILG